MSIFLLLLLLSGQQFCHVGVWAQVSLNIRDLIACENCVSTPILGGGPFSTADLLNLFILSYGLLQPQVQISYTSGAAASMTQLLTKCKTSYAFDYAIQTTVGQLEGKDQYSDLDSIPFFVQSMALVFNIPGINNTDKPINISRQVLSLIYTGNITTWNDTRILNLNPVLKTLPAQSLPITLVFRSDTSGTTRALLVALNSIDSTTWPESDIGDQFPSRVLNSTLNVIAKDQYSAISYTLTIPGAFGLIPAGFAKHAGSCTAAMINKAGRLVTCDNIDSLKAAASSVDFYSPGNRDPVDAPDDIAYPLTTFAFALYHKTTRNCDTYSAMMKFWHWCMTDQNAHALNEAFAGVTTLPPAQLQYAVEKLTNFKCDNVRILDINFEDAKLSATKQIMICVAGIALMFTVSILATLGYKRKSRVTKAAGLAFAVCFLIGCILNFVAVFFWALAPELNLICRARYSLVLLGYTLILGAMFSKSWELNKVFVAGESGVANPLEEVPWWQFCRCFFIVITIQALLLILWMSVDPPYTVALTLNSVKFSGVHTCQVRFPKVWIALESAHFVLLLVWGAYLAYQTRDVWLKYNYPNESRSILLSIYNLAFCAVILVPLMTTLEVATDTLFFLVSVAIIWPTSFALFSVYAPKLAKFLSSSYRASGHSRTDKEKGSTASTASTAGKSEAGHEKKLLDDEKRAKHERSKQKELEDHSRPASPETPLQRTRKKSPESPPTPTSTRRGVERTESEGFQELLVGHRPVKETADDF